MGLHARTLEFYRQFGFGDEVVQNGVVADSVHFRAGERDVARFSLADMGKGISPTRSCSPTPKTSMNDFS